MSQKLSFWTPRDCVSRTPKGTSRCYLPIPYHPFPDLALVWEPACHPIDALMLWHNKRQRSKQSRSKKWGQFSEISETWQNAHWVDYINNSPVHMSHSRKYFLHKNSKTAPFAIRFDSEVDIIMENWSVLMDIARKISLVFNTFIVLIFMPILFFYTEKMHQIFSNSNHILSSSMLISKIFFVANSEELHEKRHGV